MIIILNLYILSIFFTTRMWPAVLQIHDFKMKIIWCYAMIERPAINIKGNWICEYMCTENGRRWNCWLCSKCAKSHFIWAQTEMRTEWSHHFGQQKIAHWARMQLLQLDLVEWSPISSMPNSFYFWRQSHIMRCI